MGDRDQVLRDVFYQFFLCLQGSLAVEGQADPVGDPEDMGIDGHGGFVEHDGGNDIGSLPSDSGQLLQLVHVGGHYALKLLHEHLGHADQVLGLVVGVGDAADVFIDHLWGAGCQDLRGREGLEEGGRDLIDPLVSALCGEDDRDQQLIGILVVQLRLGHWHVDLKPVEHAFVSFFFSHGIFVRF